MCIRDSGYSDGLRYVNKSDYRWTEWKKLVRDELESNRPVIYSGNNSEGGHAFICDGYKEDEAFHINWGWGGISNGYFLLSALDSDGGDDPYVLYGMGIGIRPPKAGDTKKMCIRDRSGLGLILMRIMLGPIIGMYAIIFRI